MDLSVPSETGARLLIQKRRSGLLINTGGPVGQKQKIKRWKPAAGVQVQTRMSPLGPPWVSGDIYGGFSVTGLAWRSRTSAGLPKLRVCLFEDSSVLKRLPNKEAGALRYTQWMFM